MADKYSTIQQHQPLRVPAKWDKQEKALIVQLDEIFDDIYRRFGRLRMQDMNKEFQQQIEDDEGNIAELLVDVSQIVIDVGNKYDKVSGITINSNGIDIDGSKYVKIEAGSEIDVESGADLNVKSGGTLSVKNGGGIYILSGADIDIKSGGTVTVAGGNFGIDANGDATFKGGGEFSGNLIAAGGTFAGTLSANCIQGGSIDASQVTINNLDAGKITTGTMSADKISGGTLVVGGSNNTNGQIQIKNASATTIGIIDKDGFDFSGDLSINSGGTLDVDATNFKINSASKYVKSGNLTFNEYGMIKDLGSNKKFIVGDYSANDLNTVAGVYCDATSSNGGIRLLTSPADSAKSTELILETHINSNYNNEGMARLRFGGTWTMPILGNKSRPVVFIYGQRIMGRADTGTNPGCRLEISLDPDYEPESRTSQKLWPDKFVEFYYDPTNQRIILSTAPNTLSFSPITRFASDAHFASTLYYTSLVQNSSKEIKHDIKPLESQGEKLDQLRPVTFVYDNDPEENQRTGLIYEDTVDVMPEICTGDEANKAINYVELIPMLLKEIQDLRARVAALEGGN